MNVVARIDSAMHLFVAVDLIELRVTTWVGEHVIRKISGAGHEA